MRLGRSVLVAIYLIGLPGGFITLGGGCSGGDQATGQVAPVTAERKSEMDKMKEFYEQKKAGKKVK